MRDSSTMTRNILTGLVAGLASALLFASILSGSPFAVILFYAAPLPLMIVALGWSHRAGFVAALAGSLVLGLGLAPVTGLVFAVGVGAPAWALAYLAMLGRSDESGKVAQWYPVGRIVAAASLMGGAVACAGALTLGTSYEAFSGRMREGVAGIFREQMGIPAGQPLVIRDVQDPEAFVAVIAAIVPPLVVAFWVLTTLFALWLSARIVRASSRLARPWPDLASLRLPRSMGLVLGGAVAAMLLPGMAGLMGELFAAACLSAFLVLGFTALHDATRGLAARGLILGATYAICFVMTWALAVVALWGIADHLFNIRHRIAGRRGPANDNS
jgi:hypothetical protein